MWSEERPQGLAPLSSCLIVIVSLQWKAHERRLMEEENERILEFAKVQQQREEDRMEKKKQQEESMAAVQQKVRTIIAKELRVWMIFLKRRARRAVPHYPNVAGLDYQLLGKEPALFKREAEVKPTW